MKPLVFIETTIPSFYLETRTTARIEEWKELTRRWWDLQRFRFHLVTSRSVIVELAAKHFKHRRQSHSRSSLSRRRDR
ncbi:MAG TPA: hypothetical protein PKE29_14030 [Phycisphaerales bacterium]|mgnify:CR=1 FL=1|nr:hypothetical protein [Phycisphaerales bacterium]